MTVCVRCTPSIALRLARNASRSWVQFGYNYQFQRNWMVGIETDFQFAGIRGSGATTYTVNAAQAVTAVNQEIEYFGTVRARLGYLPTDQLLVYATGGFAYAQLNNAASMSASAPGINANLPSGGTIYSVNCGNGFPDTCFASSSSRLSPGWTVGGGLEYAFWQNWSLKGEYLFARFQDTLTPTAISVIPGGTASTYNAKVTTDLNLVRLGLNYKFSGY
jgi:outer membrane immunogenic protein